MSKWTKRGQADLAYRRRLMQVAVRDQALMTQALDGLDRPCALCGAPHESLVSVVDEAHEQVVTAPVCLKCVARLALDDLRIAILAKLTSGERVDLSRGSMGPNESLAAVICRQGN